MDIIDASVPESAFVTNTVDTAIGSVGVAVQNGYSYISSNLGLEIMDVSPPELTHPLASIATPGYAHSVQVSGSYAYVACDTNGIRIIKLW
jgi:hypothetical protein